MVLESYYHCPDYHYKSLSLKKVVGLFTGGRQAFDTRGKSSLWSKVFHIQNCTIKKSYKGLKFTAQLIFELLLLQVFVEKSNF